MNPMRLAGLSALVAGLCFIIVGLFHPLNIPSSVTTAAWTNVHLVAIVMSIFGLFGLAGLYARQAEKFGWFGLAGFVLFSVWLALMVGFFFIETFVLPSMTIALPAFVEGFLGMFSGSASAIDLGLLPTFWTLSGPLFIVGPLLFGIATFRAGLLPRWAGGLLAVGAVLIPVAALLPPEHEPKVMIPVGLALAWLGYAVFAERRAQSLASLAEQRTAKLKPSQVA
ncbi:MAG: hypothetical protein R3C14_49685 [Caldilineaceae bacterium]